MATRAEEFRAETERKAQEKHQRALVAKQVVRDPAAQHESVRAGKHAAYALEDAPGARPSRKSTRKSSNRQKTDVQFRMKRQVGESRPGSRSPAVAR
jgi:hypothetical protein